MKTPIRIMIFGYQKLVSPALHALGGPNSGCRYTPTCSNYFLQAVENHGSLRGSWMGVCRLCRCHPWGGHGYDPVPGTDSSARNSSADQGHTGEQTTQSVSHEAQSGRSA